MYFDILFSQAPTHIHPLHIQERRHASLPHTDWANGVGEPVEEGWIVRGGTAWDTNQHLDITMLKLESIMLFHLIDSN